VQVARIEEKVVSQKIEKEAASPKEEVRDALKLHFQKLKVEIHRQLVEGLDLTRIHKLKPERLRRDVRNLAIKLTLDSPEMMDENERERIVDEIMEEAVGLGPLEGPMHDPTVSDILVNGPREVYLERNGLLEQSDIVFADDAHLMMIIQRVAARIGRRVDEISPMLDARLPDGSRVNAIVPPLSLSGPVLSIRRSGVRLTAEDLVRLGTLSGKMLHAFTRMVAGRINILIVGGTGSGKTTLLNALSQFIPDQERLLVVEETGELKLQRPHVIKLEARPPNLEGAGEVRQRDLVRNALRMRPDRIIVGEVRGPEALDMLQAMNTGHDGSITTIHANSTRDALFRMELLVQLAGLELPIGTIRQYILSSIALVIHIARLRGGGRRVVRVSELIGLRDSEYILRDIFGYRQLGVTDDQTVGEFYATGHEPTFLAKLRSLGLDIPTSLFHAHEPVIPEPPTPLPQAPTDVIAESPVVGDVQGVVEAFHGSGARCLVMIHGHQLPVELPSEALRRHGIEENMRFQWTIRQRNTVSPDDISPLPDPMLSDADRQRLEHLYLEDVHDSPPDDPDTPGS
jgi:pilus assembly protein CpaF